MAKPLENGLIPPLDGSDGDVGVIVPEFYMCVKDTGTKYQLWISDFNIDGTFTRVHPFIISHTKTMTRTRTDKAIRVLLLGGSASNGSGAGSGHFDSHWVRSGSVAAVGFFTTVKLD